MGFESPKLLADIRHWRYKGGTEKDRQQLGKSITGKLPTQNFIRAIVRKCHEVVLDTTNTNDPLPYKAYPECGSIKHLFTHKI